MYKHILLPTDGSRLATRAVRAGFELAKSLGAAVTAVYVTPPYGIVVDDGFLASTSYLKSRYDADCDARAQKILAAVRKVGGDYPCDTVHLSADLAHEAILKTAKKNKCDLIVMASHGRRGLESLLLGSQTAKVLAHASIPVLVLH